jgi:hypothetical protein
MAISALLVLVLILVGPVIPQAVTVQHGGNPERVLLSQTLAKEVNFLHLYEGMSMEDGNGMGMGKGKSKEKGKGKDDGMKGDCIGKGSSKKCEKSPKQGTKGKGMKSKEGMGKGMTQGMSKTHIPVQSGVPSQRK